MPTYRIEAGASRVISRARSSIHDTTTTWDRLEGTVEADAETVAETGARAALTVDMTSFDAGDWLKNRKLKKDLEIERHPRAEFELGELSDVTRAEDGALSARARGVIRWRGREAAIEATGRGTLSAERLEVTATFELDVTQLGVTPPRFLMFKVEKLVEIEVRLVAAVA
jgi:polyisoprenoid-binding protein YceI